MLRGFGQAPSSDTELRAWLQGAAKLGDREGKRISYGSYVRLMTHTVKSSLPAGSFIFKKGDPVTAFYCLLEGELEVLDGSGRVVNTLNAGEYFGENSLLEGLRTRNVSIRVSSPVEILKLSKDDFEAGFGAVGGGDSASLRHFGSSSGSGSCAWSEDTDEAEEEALRARLLGFIRMVTPKEGRTLRDGEHVFREGQPVDGFYILAKGHLRVSGKQPATAAASAAPAAAAAAAAAAGPASSAVVGYIPAGGAFGEMALLSGKASRSKTVTCDSDGGCEVVKILGSDFLRLVEKSRVVRDSFERLQDRRLRHNIQHNIRQSASMGAQAERPASAS